MFARTKRWNVKQSYVYKCKLSTTKRQRNKDWIDHITNLKCILQICLTINFIHLLTEVEGNIGDV